MTMYNGYDLIGYLGGKAVYRHPTQGLAIERDHSYPVAMTAEETETWDSQIYDMAMIARIEYESLRTEFASFQEGAAMKGYWFSKEDGTTNHLSEPAKIGKTDTYGGMPIPCECGLHASPTPWDALQYANGPILWEVEIPDDAVPHGDPIDKYAATSREYLRRVDLTRACRQFAAQQALGAIDKWDAPDVVKEYLIDEAQGKDRPDIRVTARDAAWAAVNAGNAWDAAWAAVNAGNAGAAGNAAWAAVNAGNAAWAAVNAVNAGAAGNTWDAAWAAGNAGDAVGWCFNNLAIAALEETP